MITKRCSFVFSSGWMSPISTLLKRGQVTGTFDWLMPGQFLTNTLQMVSAEFFLFISSWLSALSPSLVTCVFVFCLFVFKVIYSLAVFSSTQSVEYGRSRRNQLGWVFRVPTVDLPQPSIICGFCVRRAQGESSEQRPSSVTCNS